MWVWFESVHPKYLNHGDKIQVIHVVEEESTPKAG